MSHVTKTSKCKVQRKNIGISLVVVMVHKKDFLFFLHL